MKKYIENTLIIVFIVLIIALVFIIFDKKKDHDIKYNTGDFSFTSNITFMKVKNKEFPVYFEGAYEKVLIFGIKDNKDNLGELGFKDLTLEEYSKVMFDNKESTTSKLEYNEKEEYYCYSYQVKNEETINYIAFMFEGSKNFWYISMACEEQAMDEYKDKFIEIANSVKVES